MALQVLVPGKGLPAVGAENHNCGSPLPVREVGVVEGEGERDGRRFVSEN